MQKQQGIKLARVRNFSEVFRDTVLFIRQNFSTLGKGVLYIAGPFYILVYIVQAYFLLDPLTGTIRSSLLQSGEMGIITSYAITIISAIVANMMAVGTVSYYFALCRERGQGNFTLNDLVKRVFSNFFTLLLTTILLIIICAMIAFVIGFIFYAMINLSAGLAILVGFMFAVGVLLVFYPLSYYFYAIYLIQACDRVNVFEAMARARWSMSGNYWWTWLLMFCFNLCLGIIGLSISMPQLLFRQFMDFTTIDQLLSDDTRLLILTIFGFIATFISSYINASTHVFIGIHYFSLKERIDGEGMNEEIATIGKQTETEYEATY